MTHGFSIGLERKDQFFYLSLKAIGKLTHEDYLEITPMIEGALSTVKNPLVFAFFDITELDGWEPRAAWDDFKLGLKHRNEFQKIALYGNESWQENASKFASWFISGEMKFFDDKAAALSWLSES